MTSLVDIHIWWDILILFENSSYNVRNIFLKSMLIKQILEPISLKIHISNIWPSQGINFIL